MKTLNDLVLCCVDEDRDDGGCNHAQIIARKEIKKIIKHAEKKLKKETDKETIWFVKGGISTLKRFGNLEGGEK